MLSRTINPQLRIMLGWQINFNKKLIEKINKIEPKIEYYQKELRKLNEINDSTDDDYLKIVVNWQIENLKETIEDLKKAEEEKKMKREDRLNELNLASKANLRDIAKYESEILNLDGKISTTSNEHLSTFVCCLREYTNNLANIKARLYRRII